MKHSRVAGHLLAMRQSDETPKPDITRGRTSIPDVPPGHIRLSSVLDATVAEHAARAAMPQVVFMHDPYLGQAFVFGPFSTSIGAMAFAARCTDELIYGNYVERIRTEIVALEPTS